MADLAIDLIACLLGSAALGYLLGKKFGRRDAENLALKHAMAQQEWQEQQWEIFKSRYGKLRKDFEEVAKAYLSATRRQRRRERTVGRN